MNLFEQSEENILELVEPVAKNMQIGWDENNYEKFSSHFSEEMKRGVSRENFNKQREKTFPILGKHTDLEFVALHKNPDNIVVIWKLHMEKRDVPAVVLYSFSEISGSLKIVCAGLHC